MICPKEMPRLMQNKYATKTAEEPDAGAVSKGQ